jgi:hypothetical protein
MYSQGPRRRLFGALITISGFNDFRVASMTVFNSQNRAFREIFKPVSKEANVFQELMPLLTQRTLLLIVSLGLRAVEFRQMWN